MITISGSEATIATIDGLVADMFSDVPRVTGWLEKAQNIPFTGLPARICWLGHRQRTAATLAVNELIGSGKIEGPVAFTRDHLDAGSTSIPERETEAMADGSDAQGHLGLGSAQRHAQRCGGRGPRRPARARRAFAERRRDPRRRRFRRQRHDGSNACSTPTPGSGILRYADAGYETARAAAGRYGLGIDLQLADWEEAPAHEQPAATHQPAPPVRPPRGRPPTHSRLAVQLLDLDAARAAVMGGLLLGAGGGGLEEGLSAAKAVLDLGRPRLASLDELDDEAGVAVISTSVGAPSAAFKCAHRQLNRACPFGADFVEEVGGEAVRDRASGQARVSSFVLRQALGRRVVGSALPAFGGSGRWQRGGTRLERHTDLSASAGRGAGCASGAQTAFRSSYVHGAS